MKHFVFRVINLLIGLILFSFGIVATIRANIGYAPWEVFHVGLANTLGLSVGLISVIVGAIILVIVILLGEKIGFGTVLNVIVIGIFIDLIMHHDLIPVQNSLVIGIIVLVAGFFAIAIGSCFYIKSAFGVGPRDNLMVVLTKRTKIPVGVCRSIIELSVMVVGWLLGGMVGVGTIISVFGLGFCVQITFKALKLDVTKVKHETFSETIKNLSGKHSK